VEEFDGPAALLQTEGPPLQGDDALTQPWRQNENAFILPIPRAPRQEEIQDLAPDRDEEIIPITPSRLPVVVDSPLPVQRPPVETPIRRTETITPQRRETNHRPPDARRASPPRREPQLVPPPPTPVHEAPPVPSLPEPAHVNGKQTQLIDRPIVVPKPEPPLPAPAVVKAENYRALEDDALFFDPTADPYELPAPPGFPPYQEPELAPPPYETVGELLKEEPPPPPMPPPMPAPVIPPAVLLSNTKQRKKHMLLGAPLLFLAIILLFVFAFMSK
jgi:hypothetical protein